MKNYKLVLLLIIFLASLLRLIGLGEFPSGFFRDEAALGYNAYSIWQTGRDEYGVFLPLVFRSFEVFFLPVYVYVSSLFVGVLGLTEFSTRLLSSLSGIAALFLIFYIAKKTWNTKAALFSVLILSISPWHIVYSRGAFEGNLALIFFAGGFLFWTKFLKDWSRKTFFFSVLLFVAAVYSYQAERLVVPIFALVAASAVFRRLWKVKIKLILPVIAVLIFLLPLLSLSAKPGGYHRAFGVSFFSQTEPPGWVDGEDAGFLTNNEFYLRGRQFLSLYLSYFSPRNLFVEGDFEKQRSVENLSVFYAWTMPFLALGLWRSLKRRTTEEKLLFSWILLAPLPAAMTGDPFHTYRSLLLYFPLTLFAGFGLSEVSQTIERKYRRWFTMGTVAVSVGSTLLFLFNYLVLTQAIHARAWDYGYRQIVKFLETLPIGTRIVVDDPWTEAYIHFLFFGRVSPEVYHAEVAKLGPAQDYYYSKAEEIRPNKFGSYEFRPVDWPAERGDSGTVFVMTGERLPESEFTTDPKIELLKEVFYPDGAPAYRIVKIL